MSAFDNLAFALGLSFFCVTSQAQELFPKFEEIPQELIMPRNARIATAGDGNYLVNGKPRYLFGAETGISDISGDLAPSAGYPPALKWLYEEPLNYENSQRLGIDTVAYFASHSWVKSLYPGRKKWPPAPPRDAAFVKELFSNGMPFQIDCTCFEWTHGMLAKDKELNYQIPQDAITAKDHHWVPYNIFHPEGRKIYKTIWESAIDEAKTAGLNAMLF